MVFERWVMFDFIFFVLVRRVLSVFLLVWYVLDSFWSLVWRLVKWFWRFCSGVVRVFGVKSLFVWDLLCLSVRVLR